MTITTWSAGWFLPFVLPICLWVAWSDLSRMKIPNVSVLALFGVFVVVGLIAVPFPEYLWRVAAAFIVLGIGLVLYAIGGIGAGDIKFAAAAAPFFSQGDLALLLYLFAGVLLSSLVTHRIGRRIGPLRRATPDWISWDHKNFPMGLALSATLAFYLIAGVFLGR